MATEQDPNGTGERPDPDDDEGTEKQRPEDADEPTVEEQSEQSFPASDPPSY